MPNKKIADNEPVVAEGGFAAAPAKTAAKKPRAPRASTNAVTHKHKKITLSVTPAEPVAAEVSAPVSEPSHEDIAKLAYSYWEQRGYQGGSQEEDWLRAASELRAR